MNLCEVLATRQRLAFSLIVPSSGHPVVHKEWQQTLKFTRGGANVSRQASLAMMMRPYALRTTLSPPLHPEVARNFLARSIPMQSLITRIQLKLVLARSY